VNPVRRAPGFTLIEVMAAVFLAALLAATVSLSLGGVHRAAELDELIERVQQIDRHMRRHAERHGRAQRLVIDLERQRIERRQPDRDQPIGAPLVLPTRFTIERVWTVERATNSGRAELICSADGRSGDYAIELTDQDGRRLWLVCAGLTGNWRTLDEQADATAIFDMLRGENR